MEKFIEYVSRFFSKFNLKGMTIFMPLLVSLIIAICVSYLVICKANENITAPLSYLYIAYVITGFTVVWLIILVISRYALSKRHN